MAVCVRLQTEYVGKKESSSIRFPVVQDVMEIAMEITKVRSGIERPWL